MTIDHDSTTDEQGIDHDGACARCGEISNELFWARDCLVCGPCRFPLRADLNAAFRSLEQGIMGLVAALLGACATDTLLPPSRSAIAVSDHLVDAASALARARDALAALEPADLPAIPHLELPIVDQGEHHE